MLRGNTHTFGENLTVSELESAALNIGDLLHIGAVTLQVTSPCIPCGTLAGRMEIPTFVKQFRFAKRPGLSVLPRPRGQRSGRRSRFGGAA
jgi:MOSC domain-containing protein YiiM